MKFLFKYIVSVIKKRIFIVFAILLEPLKKINIVSYVCYNLKVTNIYNY